MVDIKEETKQETDDLYMPTEVKNKMEYVKGIGYVELMRILKMAIVLLIIAILLWAFFGGITLSVIVFILGMLGIFEINRKNECNISTVDLLKQRIEYIKEQRSYRYIYRDEYMDNIDRR